MLQRISVEMLSELSKEQKERLREWWEPKIGDWYFDREIDEEVLYFICDDPWYNLKPDENSLPLLSIGQCIKILEYCNELQITRWDDWMVYSNQSGEIKHKELIQSLWQAVKAVL